MNAIFRAIVQKKKFVIDVSCVILVMFIGWIVRLGNLILITFYNGDKMRISQKRTCRSCRAFYRLSPIDTHCDIGYEQYNGKPLEPCPKPLTNIEQNKIALGKLELSVIVRSLEND